jgi:hypothetical protein
MSNELENGLEKGLENGLAKHIKQLRDDNKITGSIRWDGLSEAVGERAADTILGNAPKPFTDAEVAARVAAMKKKLDEMGF